MSTSPMYFRWAGDAMEPLNAVWAKRCDERYVIGEVYKLVEMSERTQASHDQEFAWLHTAFQNLPEDIAGRFPSEDHLRKYALIQCNFFREEIIDAGSNAAALRVAAVLKRDDQYAEVVVRGPLIARRVARSQKLRGHDHMNRDEFEASKRAIMEYIADLIGTTVEELQSAKAA